MSSCLLIFVDSSGGRNFGKKVLNLLSLKFCTKSSGHFRRTSQKPN